MHFIQAKLSYLMLQSQLYCAEIFISEKFMKYPYHNLRSQLKLNTMTAALN